MKLKLIPAAHELISNMRNIFQVGDTKLNSLNEEPLREELFSSEQMEHFGITLAGILFLLRPLYYIQKHLMNG